MTHTMQGDGAPGRDRRHPADGRNATEAEAGLRLLYVSVRGHVYLLGDRTVHALTGPPPAGVGTRFAGLAAIRDHVHRQLRGIDSIWQVRVVDDAGDVVMCGFRAGRGGTGRRWTWRPPRAASTPADTDR